MGNKGNNMKDNNMRSNLIIHNPLDDELPTDPVDRIHRLARDLAWGALNNLWDAQLETRRGAIVAARNVRGGILSEYLHRWGDMLPSTTLLGAFGYMTEDTAQSASGATITVGSLTMAAFALLKHPARTPEVYISYHPAQSSALALLLLARLQITGVKNPYVDMNRNPGDALHMEQEARVRGSDFVVCLLAPGTLDSDYVQAEVHWGLDSEGTNVIPVWHNRFAPQHDYPQALALRNAIRVEEENATAYNDAIIRVINRVGYAP